MLRLHCVEQKPHIHFESTCNTLQFLQQRESAMFEKNLQKIFILSFELKETALFSFKDILDCPFPSRRHA